MILIGHRGLAGLAPENTLAGFRKAAEHGISMVEFDVRLSKDGVPVVFHDHGLERTTNGFGPVADQDWRQLQALDAGSWFAPAFAGEGIPSLEQVLRLCLGLGLAVNMEIKPDQGREEETALAALALGRTLWPDGAPPPLISSFGAVCLETACRAAPHWPRALLAGILPSDWRELARSLDASALHLDHGDLTQGQVAEIMEEGLAVRAYTVNDPFQAARMGKWGVAAIFSDHPQSS